MANWFSKIGRGIGKFMMGTPAKQENISTLRPEQEGLYNQLVNAGMQQGTGGAFGDVADYYRGNLSNDPADFNAFAAPQLRQYNEDIVPGLSEQFAGMGAGGLSSSGFRNAQIQGATDLSERLGAIRAGLRQQSAQGLMGIGQQGLQSYSNPTITQPGTQGFLSSIAPAIGQAAGAWGGGFFNGMGNQMGQNMVGKNTSPYGNLSASPKI